MGWRHTAVVMAAIASSGCGTEATEENGPLTDPALWVESDPADDPYDDRPPGAVCEAFGWAIEEGILEVQADVCAYVTLEQGLLREVRPGERVIVDVWNLGLWADPPAEGHVSVELDGERWEARPAIPSAPERWQAAFDVDRTIPAGTRIYLHVHNHGANSWRFGPPTSR